MKGRILSTRGAFVVPQKDHRRQNSQANPAQADVSTTRSNKLVTYVSGFNRSERTREFRTRQLRGPISGRYARPFSSSGTVMVPSNRSGRCAFKNATNHTLSQALWLSVVYRFHITAVVFTRREPVLGHYTERLPSKSAGRYLLDDSPEPDLTPWLQ